MELQGRTVEFDLLGWPDDSVTLQLDHTQFSYAGKFVMSNTGKAIAQLNGNVIAALAFNRDRTDSTTLWIRYLSVRDEYRQEGVGPALVSFLRDECIDKGVERIRIAVNNPYAYVAMYTVDFEYIDAQTGLAELILEWPGLSKDAQTHFQSGLEEFSTRELTDNEHRFIDRWQAQGSPSKRS